MLKKFVLGLFAGIGLSGAATLTELLNSVQNEITKYEEQGLAIENPYIYTKLKEYYKYGKLYTAYLLSDHAIALLQMASCSVAPIDCYPHKYFYKHLTFQEFAKLYYKMPITLARIETSFNAYAEWWIGKHFENKEVYREYKNLEGILRADFFERWKTFLLDAPKPLVFRINRWGSLKPDDIFLLNMLRSAYFYMWIKRIVFYGDSKDYQLLINTQILPKKAVIFGKAYENLPYNYIWVY